MLPSIVDALSDVRVILEAGKISGARSYCQRLADSGLRDVGFFALYGLVLACDADEPAAVDCLLALPHADELDRSEVLHDIGQAWARLQYRGNARSYLEKAARLCH